MRRLAKIMTAVMAVTLAAAGAASAAVSSLRVITLGGDRYLSLRDVAAHYGFTLRVPPGRHVYLQGKWSSMDFEVDSREAHFNGTLVWLHAPLVKSRGRWLVTEADVKKVIDPLLRPDAYLLTRGMRVVVLDPGHGGEDRGARGRRGVEEKRVVLDIAKRARAHLANAGLKVYLTRETDRRIELEGRSWKASKWGADAFVSIHLNSGVSPAPKGLETYVLTAAGYPATAASSGARIDRDACVGNRFDGANSILGCYLQKALLGTVKGEDRGLRRARFVVLRNAPCPAALVECGFVSNAGEEAKMLSSDHREKIALAVAKGILDYVNAVRKARAAADAAPQPAR